MKENSNIIGTRIGIYDVLHECDFKSSDGHRMYHVRCSKCGWETNMQKRIIKRTKKCTHINKNGSYKMFNVYIWENKRISKIFHDIKSRCYNPNDKNYRWYGEKGIKVCDEWMNNPKSFEEWALNNGYTDNMTIDRIEEDKDYCPENCQWVVLENNSRYKSTTSYIYVNGEVHTGREWAEILGLGINRINIYIREYGIENTREFIRRYLDNPGLHPSHHQSFYDLYMR